MDVHEFQTLYQERFGSIYLSIKATASRMGLTEVNIKILQFRALKRAAALNLFDRAQKVS
jgi:hypothetical protein